MKAIKDLKLEEALDLLNYVGIDDAETFKDTFGTKFFTKETALENDEIKKAIVGKRMTDITSSLLRLGKVVNPELSMRELTKKHVEENIEDITEMFTNRISELDTKAKSGNDKKVTDLEKQLDEISKSVSVYKEVNEKLTAEYDTLKSGSANEMKSYKINHQYEQLKNQLSWIDEPTQVQRSGFDAIVSSNYKFDLDEKDNLRILDKEGKPIISKNKAAVADPLEILDVLLDQNKLKKNNNAKSNNFVNFGQQSAQPETGRKLSKDYLKRVGG